MKATAPELMDLQERTGSGCPFQKLVGGVSAAAELAAPLSMVRPTQPKLLLLTNAPTDEAFPLVRQWLGLRRGCVFSAR
nr:hypothetical protein [Streptomyces californicus]